ncbi:hypothetical protein BGY98DRAFT_1007136 [Russula aff. rugulosa BPL654]|nr:hypothetical protein BGY98DRAFT_1007136 [Russula aff. rugulosa BPL654]
MRPADCFAPLYLPPLRGDKRVTKVSDIDVIWFVERSEGNKVAQKEKKRGLFTQNCKFWFFSGLFSVGRRGYTAVRARYYSRFWPRTGPRQPFAKWSVGVTSEGERSTCLSFLFFLILLVVSSVTSLEISRAALHARRPRDNLPCCVNRKRARHRGVAFAGSRVHMLLTENEDAS